MLPLLALSLLLSSDSTPVYRGNAGELQVTLPRIENAAINVDGRLDEAAWRQAALLTGFTQYEPIEGQEPKEQTEVRVFYGPDAIYFGVIAHDSEPAKIRATMADRDRTAMTDDWIRILLDTFNDHRQAYAFYVNPYGIQSDGLWIEGRGGHGGRAPTSGNTDFNPDFIWQSDARRSASGWVAEIRVPYVSLRFPQAEVQNWGLNIGRGTQRDGYKYSWAAWTTNMSNFLAQGGQLVGLHGLKPQRLIEVNPVTTGRRTGQITAGQFGHSAYEQEFGLNARYGITQNMTLDATINPDFSQIESDADQITANERFAISFPEKRPFFLEGAEIFQTPQRLVYTRAIVSPSAGAKVTGKVGAVKIGYLGAYDESPFGVSDEANATVNLFRVQRDVGLGSTVGALFTDRTLTNGAGFNRVASVDARLALTPSLVLTSQLASSWTRGAEGRTVAAPMLSMNLDRTGRVFGYQLALESIDREFDAQSGFLQRHDARALAVVRSNFYRRRGSLLERFSLNAQVEGFFDEDEFWSGARPMEGEFELHPAGNFRRNQRIGGVLRVGYYRFEPAAFAGWQRETAGSRVAYAPRLEVTNLLGMAVLPTLRPSQKVQIGGRMYLREVPIYAEGSRGFEVQLAPEVRTWPTDGLAVDLNFARSRLRRVQTEQLFSSQDIARIKAQYQFSKAVMARVFVQYNLYERDALRDQIEHAPVIISGRKSAPISRTDVGANFLLQYEPSPGTIFYVGYGRQLQALERTYAYDALRPTSDGLFIKLSYLRRL